MRCGKDEVVTTYVRSGSSSRSRHRAVARAHAGRRAATCRPRLRSMRCRRPGCGTRRSPRARRRAATRRARRCRSTRALPARCGNPRPATSPPQGNGPRSRWLRAARGRGRWRIARGRPEAPQEAGRARCRRTAPAPPRRRPPAGAGCPAGGGRPGLAAEAAEEVDDAERVHELHEHVRQLRGVPPRGGRRRRCASRPRAGRPPPASSAWMPNPTVSWRKTTPLAWRVAKAWRTSPQSFWPSASSTTILSDVPARALPAMKRFATSSASAIGVPPPGWRPAMKAVSRSTSRVKSW